MAALAEGKINFIVECNPLLGPQLMDLAEKVLDGEEVPERVVTEETTFTQEQAAEVASRPPVLSRPQPRLRAASRDRRGPGPRPADGEHSTEEEAMTQIEEQPRSVARARDDRPQPMIEMRDISITFGAVRALSRTSACGCSPVRCTP